MKFRFLVFTFFILAVPAYANVVISEIMYDLEGADTGREWVEIKNESAAVDLTGWKFFEGGVNHGLNLVQGDISLSENGFAIIADNAEKFLLDWPEFSGTVFDSSFSLSNTGETIALRDTGLEDIDSVSYLSEWGANGDGNSLQKLGSTWSSATPIPNEQKQKEEMEEDKISPPLQGGDGGGNGSTPEPSPAPFSTYAGEDKSAIAGAEVYFEGQVEGVEEELAQKGRFLWNFGDGATGEGRNIKHSFKYPGIYIINLDASFGMYSDSDSLKVSVSSTGISISEIEPGEFIKIKNDSKMISDISGFGIQINDSKIFNFPKDTKLAANSFLTLDSLMLGLEISDTGEAKILYPNGKILFSFEIKKPLSTKADNSKTISQNNTFVQIPQKTPLLDKEGVGGDEASVIKSQSFWSEIKWLVFGIVGGLVIGLLYLFLKKKFLSVKTSKFTQ